MSFLASTTSLTSMGSHGSSSDLEGLVAHDYKPNSAFMKKIPKGSEVCNIMVGELDELEAPLIALIRLKEARLLEGISEVKLPTRYECWYISLHWHSRKWFFPAVCFQKNYIKLVRTHLLLLVSKIFPRHSDEKFKTVSAYLSSSVLVLVCVCVLRACLYAHARMCTCVRKCIISAFKYTWLSESNGTVLRNDVCQ